MTATASSSPSADTPGASTALLRTYVSLPAATALYAGVLHWLYTSFVVPNFAYVGYHYERIELVAHVVTWMTVTVVAATLPRAAGRVSDVTLWVLFVVVVAPTMLVMPYMGQFPAWDAIVFGSGMGIAFMVTVVVARSGRPGRRLLPAVSPASFWICLGILTLTTYGYLASTAGIQLRFLAFADVYDVRADYRESLAAASVLGYLVSTQANVVNPLIIARAIQVRRFGIVAVATAGQLLLYVQTGFKSVLFSLAAIVVLTAFFRRPGRPLVLFLWGAVGLLLATWILDAILGTVVWTSIFGRRFIFTPARLSALYFDWYSNNPLSLLGNSVLAPFVDTNYQFGPARTISVFATGSPSTSMNANVYASGFAEFGWVGLVGVALLVGLYLRLVDRAAHRLPVRLGAIAVVMPAVTLSNTSFQTSLLSHGLVMSVLLLALTPRPEPDQPDLPPRSHRSLY